MKGLRGLLIRKIVITAVFWCVPLILFPPSLFVLLGIPSPQPLIFVRLLGIAYCALLIGYYGGIKALDKHQDPIVVLNMAIVSNGGAGLIFLYFGITGGWSGWGAGAQIYMWLFTLGTFIMTSKTYHARKKYADMTSS